MFTLFNILLFDKLSSIQTRLNYNDFKVVPKIRKIFKIKQISSTLEPKHNQTFFSILEYSIVKRFIDFYI